LRLTRSSGSLKHPKGGKLRSWFIGPFPILERIGVVAYCLNLSDRLTSIHNVFHVLQLKKYNPDLEHVLNKDPLQLLQNLSYLEKPKEILERSVKELRNKKIPMVKVLWEHHSVQDATWKTEEWMKKKYPKLF
jgi:hypothetical protein